MSYCKYCGAKLSEEQKFCTNCGNKIENGSVSSSENSSKSSTVNSTANNTVNNAANSTANNTVNNTANSTENNIENNTVDNSINNIDNSSANTMVNNQGNHSVNSSVNNDQRTSPKINHGSTFGPPDSFNSNIKKEKPKKRGGCLRIFLIALGVLLVLFIGLIFIGNDQDNTGNNINYNALNELDFYNIKEIPVLETDEELNEYYLPYIVRGVSERYAGVMDESLNLLSQEYITNTSYDEYKQKVSELLYDFEQVEMLSVTFQGKLAVYEDELEQANQKNNINIPFTITAYAWTKDEVYEVMDEARKKGINKIEYLAQHLGTSARNAHKVLLMCNDISEAEYYNDDNDRMEWVDRGREALELAGKGARVYITYATGGAAALVGNPLAIISSTDLVLEATEKGAFVAFGDNPKVKALTAPISELRNNKYYQAGMGVVSLLSMNVNDSGKVDFKGNMKFGNVDFKKALDANNGAELFNNMFSLYDVGKDAFQGKVIGIDLEEATSTLMEDEEVDAYLQEKGLEDDAGYIMSDDEYENIKEMGNYQELSTDEYIAYMNKRNDEIWVQQDNLNSNLDDTIAELENMIDAYSQGDGEDSNNTNQSNNTNSNSTNSNNTDTNNINTNGSSTDGTNTNGSGTSGTDAKGSDTNGINTNGTDTEGTSTGGIDTNSTDTDSTGTDDIEQYDNQSSDEVLSVVNFVDKNYNGQIAAYGGSFYEDGSRVVVDIALYAKDGNVEQIKFFMGMEVIATWAQEASIDTYVSTEEIYNNILSICNADVIDSRDLVEYSAIGVMVHFKNNGTFNGMSFSDMQSAIQQLRNQGYVYVASYNMD